MPASPARAGLVATKRHYDESWPGSQSRQIPDGADASSHVGNHSECGGASQQVVTMPTVGRRQPSWSHNQLCDERSDALENQRRDCKCLPTRPTFSLWSPMLRSTIPVGATATPTYTGSPTRWSRTTMAALGLATCMDTKPAFTDALGRPGRSWHHSR